MKSFAYILFLLAFVSCEIIPDLERDNPLDGYVEEKESLEIGDEYEGGIVAYIFKSGDNGYVEGLVNGLIAAPSDQSGAKWGCYATSIEGTSISLGSGQANTNLIVNNCNENNIAAKICNELVLNSKSDWYLPSKDELNKLYEEQSVIGGFAGSSYWSSSEFNNYDAWYHHFPDWEGQNRGRKDATMRIRCIRTF